ncbi:MAG: hypothetical protein OJF50_000952 [Nitrospira sp.]|jgi:hypothetical protein|nr:hypothetical protein [Nitrospira sp.]
MNRTFLTFHGSALYFSFLNLPSLIFTYLTHSIRIVLKELKKLLRATRSEEGITKRNERLTGNQALIVGSGVGAPVFNTNVYITRGDGITRLVAP